MLSDRPDIQFEFVVFRLGWIFKNMHSLYDYVSTSRIKDIAAAKGLAKWHTKSRGVSATYLSIKTEEEKHICLCGPFLVIKNIYQ